MASVVVDLSKYQAENHTKPPAKGSYTFQIGTRTVLFSDTNLRAAVNQARRAASADGIFTVTLLAVS